MTSSQTNNLDPERCATIIRGVLGMKRRKQIELADKLGLNRVVLNMYLNRKVNLLPGDIERILEELNVTPDTQIFAQDIRRA
jgi:transcriptional regulator with XRE-family HTH domain